MAGRHGHSEAAESSNGPYCQIRGCCADLQNEKVYYQKKRICSFHMQEDVVYKKDEPGAWRFCFQCGKLEPLEVFDAKQRSCRTRLLQRRKPHKRPGDNLADPLLQQQPQQQQPQQKQRPKHRAKRTPRSNCSHQRGSKSPVTENSAGEEEQQQQQQLQDLMQWQYSCPLQEEQGPHQDLGFSTWGYSADSFPTSPVAAAAAQWQQQLASHPAETQDAAVPIPTPAAAPTAALPPWRQPSLISAWGCSADSCQGDVPSLPPAAAATAAQWQQRMGSLAAGIQDVAVPIPTPAAPTAVKWQPPSLVSAWGCSGDSCQREVPTSPAAAATVQWQQRMGSLAAGIQDAAACLTNLQRSSTALSAASVAALLSDQAPAVTAAGIQDAAACLTNLQRSNTMLSARP